MPITLSKIANNEASVTFHYGEDEITLKYYPGRITEKTFAQLQAFSRMEGADDVIEGFGKLNELLVSLLKSWDVLEDDEKTMFPIGSEHLAVLPIPFRVAVLQAVMRDIRPNEIAPKTTLN
jgi:hypothetical protein